MLSGSEGSYFKAGSMSCIFDKSSLMSSSSEKLSFIPFCMSSLAFWRYPAMHETALKMSKMDFGLEQSFF